MMFTNLEVQTGAKSRFNHVRLTIEDSNVVLKSLAGQDKGSKVKIPINEIEWHLFDLYYGGQRWSFNYQDATWRVGEVGFGLFEYIRKNLPDIDYVTL